MKNTLYDLNSCVYKYHKPIIYEGVVTKETEFENDNYETIKLAESEYIKYF